MREYDLYVPVVSSSGKPFSPAKLERLKKRLISRFGGITHFPQRNKGVWKLGKVVFRDEVIILRALAPHSKGVRQFWRKLKQQICVEWNQKEVLIVVRKVRTV